MDQDKLLTDGDRREDEYFFVSFRIAIADGAVFGQAADRLRNSSAVRILRAGRIRRQHRRAEQTHKGVRS